MTGCVPPSPAPASRGVGAAGWDEELLLPIPMLLRMAGRGQGRCDCLIGGGAVV